MRKLLLVISLITGISYSGIAQIDTNLVVYSWKLDQSLANRLRVDVDTLLDNFQQYNPAIKKFTGIQTLGNFGQPAISIVYPEREESEFLMVNNFYPFMK